MNRGLEATSPSFARGCVNVRKPLVILTFSQPEGQSLFFSRDSGDLRSRASVTVPPLGPDSLFNRILGYRAWELRSFMLKRPA